MVVQYLHPLDVDGDARRAWGRRPRADGPSAVAERKTWPNPVRPVVPRRDDQALTWEGNAGWQSRTTSSRTASYSGGRLICQEPALTVNGTKVLERRYLHRIENRVVETPGGGFWRVAEEVARGGASWIDQAGLEARTREYYGAMQSLEFLPNSPTLMNAGKRNGLQYSACYVLPVEDSMDGIFESVKRAALIHKSGGGTGFAFSRLRPSGDLVGTTGGVASGPVSFMEVFNGATESVKQGGTRRGANMGILRIDHPDVLHFINCKRELRDGPRAAYEAVADGSGRPRGTRCARACWRPRSPTSTSRSPSPTASWRRSRPTVSTS